MLENLRYMVAKKRDVDVEVGAVAPADLIAPSPRSYHTYYTPSPTYSNFRFVRVQELTEIQHSYH